jgi:HSP20 family protein
MFGCKRSNVEMVPQYWTLGPVSMFHDMERLMNELHPWSALQGEGSPETENARMAVVDLREEKDRYVVQADIPGMAKEDVSIEMDDETLHISACKERSLEESSEGYIRKERGGMCFFRQLPLPSDVDREGIKARLENGVLEISLPKLQKAEEKKTKIEVE